VDRKELEEALVKSGISQHGIRFKETVMESSSNAVEAIFSFSDKYVYKYLWRNICMNL